MNIDWHIIDPTVMEGVPVDPGWLRNIRETRCCSARRHLAGTHKSAGVDIAVTSRPPRHWINGSPILHVSVIRRDIHEALFSHLGDRVSVGSVMTTAGVLL